MLSQVGTLGKAFVTARDRASKRLFVGVNPQMIKEIASFSELFVTSRILTLHNSPDSPSINMFVPENLVVCSIRNMFAFAN